MQLGDQAQWCGWHIIDRAQKFRPQAYDASLAHMQLVAILMMKVISGVPTIYDFTSSFLILCCIYFVSVSVIFGSKIALSNPSLTFSPL